MSNETDEGVGPLLAGDGEEYKVHEKTEDNPYGWSVNGVKKREIAKNTIAAINEINEGWDENPEASQQKLLEELAEHTEQHTYSIEEKGFEDYLERGIAITLGTMALEKGVSLDEVKKTIEGGRKEAYANI